MIIDLIAIFILLININDASLSRSRKYVTITTNPEQKKRPHGYEFGGYASSGSLCQGPETGQAQS